MNNIKLLKEKVSYINQRKDTTVTFLNPFSYLYFRKNLELFNQFDKIGVDGISLVYLLSLIGIKIFKRESFDMTSMAPIVFNECVESDKSIFFIGSKEDEITKFYQVIKQKYPKLNIIGIRNGYFIDDKERDEVINNIVKLNPDVVVVGMGTPYQEQFLIDIKKMKWKGTGYTCGGFFHQTAKGIDYYPKFYNEYNLRWLYRMIDEPKLIKRYFISYPKSIILFLYDYIQYKFS